MAIVTLSFHQVKNGNFNFTVVGNVTDLVVKNGNLHANSYIHGQEWQFHIATDI